MFCYYLDLAFRSLQRNATLALLMVAAIGLGIGTSMTAFTMLYVLSGDPIPEKSSQLFVPLIDNWGPHAPIAISPTQLSYLDAIALMRARRGIRQSAMYSVQFSVTPAAANARPFVASGRAVYTDFFRMFDVPFRTGNPWRNTDDEDRSNVVVLGAKIADKLFPRSDAVGQIVNLDHQNYRIVGVLKLWEPIPRFYDLDGVETEDIFLPFQTAIGRQIERAGKMDCVKQHAPGWVGQLDSECNWIGFWVELPNTTAAQSYRQFLFDYAAGQVHVGRFHWAPRVALYNVREWLTKQHVVPDEVRLATLAAFGFLLVCLLNSIGIMLAKFSTSSGEFCVRRALGASKGDIAGQCLTEAAVVGAAGAVLGLGLTMLGLKLERSIVGDDLARAMRLDLGMVNITVTLAIIASVSSALYPAWLASRVHPASQLKAQ